MGGGDAGSDGRSRDLLVAALVAAVVLALGLAGVQRSRSLADERRTSADLQVLARAVSATAIDLEALAADVAAEALSVSSGVASPAGFVPADPNAAAPSPALSAEDRSDVVVSAALDRARDSAETLLTAPVDLGAGPRALVVAAAYVPESGRPIPGSTVERRRRLSGWSVRAIDLGAVLGSNLGSGAVGTVSDGLVTWSVAGGEGPSRLPSQTLDTHGRQLVIRAGSAAPIGIAAPTIALLASTVVVAVAAFGAVLGASRLIRQREADVRDRAGQVRLIGEVAPLVQQSLELAEILPAIAVLLSDHFGLAGVSLSTPSAGSGNLELFALGEAPEANQRVLLHPPLTVAAGETLSLALQRGGRSVALLQLVAGRDLAAAELESLRAVTEFITAAVVNSALYASQQAALRQLRELDALKTVFLGTASHELRTPATAIGGFAALLTASWDKFDDAQRRDFVGRIGANAQSLTAVVQDLLDFSLLDKGTVAVSIVEVDLAALVGSVVDRLGPVFPQHEIAFSASPAPAIAGDVNGLERIVTNLLTNATKFSPAGTTVTVTVGAGGGGYGAELAVSDEGPGIPAEDRPHIFSRFYRGSSDAVTRTRGAGIGLSVVSEFVARLRGEIVVDDVASGARIIVRFPASTTWLLAKETTHAPTT